VAQIDDYITVPMILIALGAFLVVAGSFWATLRENRDKIQFANERAEFEKELRAKSEEIAKLNIFIKESITGGDSYCYIYFGDAGNNMITPIIHHEGKYPLYDITIRLIDMDLWGEGQKENDQEKINSSIKE